MYLDIFAKHCHENAKNKGFWEISEDWYEQSPLLVMATKIALVHSELSEALEKLRVTKMWEPSGSSDEWNMRPVAEELCDTLIRVFDLLGYLRSDPYYKVKDIDRIVQEIMQKNAKRPFMHGKNF